MHTAKDVDYCITGFRMKNKDELSNDLEEIMDQSDFKTISRIFSGINVFQENMDEVSQEEEEKDDKESVNSSTSLTNEKRHDKFISGKFRKQMKDLMSELNSCNVSFIRCIKPNEEKRKNFFVPQLALCQIRYLGVLESIKIRKDSYPIRKFYKNFYEKYAELDQETAKTSFLDF